MWSERLSRGILLVLWIVMSLIWTHGNIRGGE